MKRLILIFLKLSFTFIYLTISSFLKFFFHSNSRKFILLIVSTTRSLLLWLFYLYFFSAPRLLIFFLIPQTAKHQRAPKLRLQTSVFLYFLFCSISASPKTLNAIYMLMTCQIMFPQNSKQAYLFYFKVATYMSNWHLSLTHSKITPLLFYPKSVLPADFTILTHV